MDKFGSVDRLVGSGRRQTKFIKPSLLQLFISGGVSCMR